MSGAPRKSARLQDKVPAGAPKVKDGANPPPVPSADGRPEKAEGVLDTPLEAQLPAATGGSQLRAGPDAPAAFRADLGGSAAHQDRASDSHEDESGTAPSAASADAPADTAGETRADASGVARSDTPTVAAEEDMHDGFERVLRPSSRRTSARAAHGAGVRAPGIGGLAAGSSRPVFDNNPFAPIEKLPAGILTDSSDDEDDAPAAPERNKSPERIPAARKGKGADPRNWGDVDLGEGDDFLDDQEALLEWAKIRSNNKEILTEFDRIRDQNALERDERDAELTRVRRQHQLMQEERDRAIARADKARRKSDRVSRHTQAAEEAKLIRRMRRGDLGATFGGSASVAVHTAPSGVPLSFRPRMHVPASSYLSRAWDANAAGPVRNRRHRRGSPSDSSTSSSSSSSSDSSSNDGSSSSDSTSDSDNGSSSDGTYVPKKRRARRGRSPSRRAYHKRKPSRRAKPSRVHIKPVPPEKYSGDTADPREFFTFSTTLAAFFRDANVPEDEQVAQILPHVQGRAHEFYMRRVAMDPYVWTFDEFMRALYDNVFPVNYTLLLRKRWKRARQGTQTVREFLY
jgi:hypothetical protein